MRLSGKIYQIDTIDRFKPRNDSRRLASTQVDHARADAPPFPASLPTRRQYAIIPPSRKRPPSATAHHCGNIDANPAIIELPPLSMRGKFTAPQSCQHPPRAVLPGQSHPTQGGVVCLPFTNAQPTWPRPVTVPSPQAVRCLQRPQPFAGRVIPPSTQSTTTPPARTTPASKSSDRACARCRLTLNYRAQCPATGDEGSTQPQKHPPTAVQQNC